MKKILIAVFSVVLSLSITVSCLAAGVYYLPDVTSEMSSPSYWAEESDILMSYDEIENLNRETIQTKGTNMYGLKNQPEVVDGISLNEAIKNQVRQMPHTILDGRILKTRKKPLRRITIK